MVLFAPRPKDDTKTYNRLWRVVPGVVVFLFFSYQHALKAAGEEHTARRQETAFGEILDCKAGGKSGKSCHYVFQTEDEQSYVGVGHASSDVEMGQTVNIYYDSQNPRISALESFSVSGRDDQTWAYIFLLLAAAFVAVAFYSKANQDSDRRSP